MAISKRLRFEIFRRDNHTCRYCGNKAPDVKLTVDHVMPEALGGDDEPTNLVTACEDCNSGKTSIAPDSPLVDDIDKAASVWNAALAKAQEEASEKFDQREPLIGAFLWEWDEKLPQFARLPDDYEQTVVDFYAKGLSLDAIDEAIAITASKRGTISQAQMWSYFCGICWNKIRELEKRAREIIENGELDNG